MPTGHLPPQRPPSSPVPSRRSSGPVLVAAVVLLAAWAAVCLAQESGDRRAERGERLYSIYCANCHGQDGRGDGPMASILEIPPTDLTTLAARAGGTFPSAEVYTVIEGDQNVLAHGQRQMPVWGQTFRDPGRDSSQHEEVRRKILDLVAHLRAIQEPTPDPGPTDG